MGKNEREVKAINQVQDGDTHNGYTQERSTGTQAKERPGQTCQSLAKIGRDAAKGKAGVGQKQGQRVRQEWRGAGAKGKAGVGEEQGQRVRQEWERSRGKR